MYVITNANDDNFLDFSDSTIEELYEKYGTFFVSENMLYKSNPLDIVRLGDFTLKQAENIVQCKMAIRVWTIETE